MFSDVTSVDIGFSMIIIIKHIQKEGPGTIAEYFKDAKIIELEKGDTLPSDINDIDAVFSMGGPMNVYEEDKYPFLKDEDRFIKLLIKEEVPFMGICLGAQLLAKACGALVYKAPVREVGWHNVELSGDPLFKGLSKNIDVLQWHEDTFDIPSNGILLATGRDVRNQAFRFGKCAYGIQFHIEVTPQMIIDWFGNDAVKYKIPDEERFKNQAVTVYENFLGLSAQKLGTEPKLYRKVIDSVEKKLIESVLEKTEGNQIQAADILGINRNTLRAKIRKLRIEVYR